MIRSRRPSKKVRQGQILVGLRVSAVRTPDLATELGVSAETIRRDLKDLAEKGSLHRTYGGAIARPNGAEAAWNERFKVMTEERALIAALAVRLVRPGEVLAIDAGSTTLHFAHRLAAEVRDLTVVTNSFAVAMALAANGSIQIIACPGRYDPHEGNVTGGDTLAFLSRFNLSRAFIGASGITANGISDANSDAAAIKRLMLARAREGVLLVDHGKFGQQHLEVVCPLDAIKRIVTDRAPGGDFARALRQAKIKIDFGNPDDRR
jgi:DeoR/GlpR family transcriptional regulator of sugar metabolism